MAVDVFELIVRCCGLLAVYAVCLVAMTTPFVQRHVFYLHKLPIWWRQNLDIPESVGFLHNQVLPLRISTNDGERLFAWLIVPLALYAKHEQHFAAETGSNWTNCFASKLLQRQESRLIIYMHGNAGSIAQTRRTDAYRMITGSSEDVFVLAFDYRGFSRSTGSPSERGLTEDTVSVIRWALTIGKVPPSRIVIVAQSLGTAVATAAVKQMSDADPHFQLAGLVLCAAFTEAAAVICAFKIWRFPVLFPLRLSSTLRAMFTSCLKDKWQTQRSLVSVIAMSSIKALVLIADLNDRVVPYKHTVSLFDGILAGAEQRSAAISEQSTVRKTDLGHGGSIKELRDGGISIRQVLLNHGGHNGIMKWSPVALEVFRILQSSYQSQKKESRLVSQSEAENSTMTLSERQYEAVPASM